VTVNGSLVVGLCMEFVSGPLAIISEFPSPDRSLGGGHGKTELHSYCLAAKLAAQARFLALGAVPTRTHVILLLSMNWMVGLLIYFFRYFTGWGSPGLHTIRAADELSRELGRVWNEADHDSRTNSRVAPEVDFVSAAVPVEGAVDYQEMKWDSFTRVVETSEQFAFYSGKSVARLVARRSFTSHQEILALRRVIRRRVHDSQLLDD
jgi:hypothetical protein